MELFTLDKLLARCHVKRYHEGIWFNGVTLKGVQLNVPDEQRARFIERHWGAVMREHIPDLRIVDTSQQQPERLAVEPRPAKKLPPQTFNRQLRHQEVKQRLGGLE